MTCIDVANFRARRTWAAALIFICTLVGASYGQTYAAIPAGTQLLVRINENLSSGKANVGDRFTGTLVRAVVANGRTIFSRGATLTGEVTAVDRSGRLSHPGELRLELRTIRSGGRTYDVAAQPFVIEGESHTKSNVTKIGGGTAAGAIIGAIAGGGKGAAIGAGVGAAGGTGVAAATGKKEASVESEAILAWVASDPPAIPLLHSPVVRASRLEREPAARNSYAGPAPESHSTRSYGREPSGFSAQDRQVLMGCFSDGGTRGLPPGLAKKNSLPPGLERQVERNGTLPPGLQKRVAPLPQRCEARLPRLPEEWSRVVLSGRILLLDSSRRIVDLLWLPD